MNSIGVWETISESDAVFQTDTFNLKVYIKASLVVTASYPASLFILIDSGTVLKNGLTDWLTSV
jgi:hypothetical protein